MATAATAERESRWDSWRALLRVIAEIVLWTVLGLVGLGFAFRTYDYEYAMIYWWTGNVVWVGGVSWAVLGAYRRGEERGDW